MNKHLTKTNDPVWELLICCSSIHLNTQQLNALSNLASIVNNWDRAIQQAELHGLAPLLYQHLKDANTEIPSTAARQLKALVLRHQRASQIRTLAMAELLERLEDDDITIIVLKGAALARLVYPQSSLRPMRDIDILTSSSQAPKIQAILRQLGYAAPDHHGGSMYDHHHLPNASRVQDGMMVSIEVHHDAYSGDARQSLTTSNLYQPPQSLVIGGKLTSALGHIDMLRHLCQHSFEPAEGYKLGTLVDIYAYLEKHHQEIDWNTLRQDLPTLANQLRNLHLLKPLPAMVEPVLQPLPSSSSVNAGQCLRPLSTIFQSKQPLVSKILEVLIPPTWWTHGFYGLNPTQSLSINRIFTHPITVMRWWLRRRAARKNAQQ